MNDAAAVKVAFSLRRRAERTPAVAVLLPSLDAGELIRLCAPLCQPNWPVVFQVAGGFLVKLTQPSTRAFPGTIRLRSLASNLYLPVDAELCPPLLEDEATALTHERGLVFLPGGRVLGFAAAEPLSVARFVKTGPIHQPGCRPLPQPAELADRLTAIVFEGGLEAPDEIIEAGGEGIGDGPHDQPGPGIGSQLLGGMAAGLGGMLAGLGKLVPVPGIRKLGAKLIEKGLNLAPKISSAFLGRQEVALRALLQKFREGNVEEALRRALPMSDEPGRGAQVGTGWQLPFHNLFYSLTNVLGDGGGSRPVSLWYGGLNVQDELRKEYRRQAELATQRGDYRRAAFIYAKLLGDFRMAANVLTSGGLHRDAAIIYLKKLDDKLAAARAFEKAGDFDRALRIYRGEHWHEAAGDLHRRMGEEDLAVAEYQIAAQRLIEVRNDYYQAGELLAQRARRQDLALPIYQAGWSEGRANQALPCAKRLLDIWAQREAFHELHALTGEVSAFLRQAGSDTEAAGFFNEVATIAERENLASVRAELRDQALLGLAARLKADPRAVGRLFTRGDVWTSPLISDAEYAVRAARKSATKPVSRQAPLYAAVVQGRIPTVTAVHYATDAAGLYVGFASGEVVHYDVDGGAMTTLPHAQSSITVSALHPIVSSASEPSVDYCVEAIATDVTGKKLVVLRKGEKPFAVLASSGHNQLFGEARKLLQHVSCLSPHLGNYGDWNVALVVGDSGAQLVASEFLAPIGRFRLPRSGGEAATGLLLQNVRPATTVTRALLFHQAEIWLCPLEDGDEAPTRHALGWTPEIPEGSTLRQPQLAWLPAGEHDVELVGLTSAGTLRWSRLKIGDDDIELVATRFHHPPTGGYRAATLVREGFAAAVRADGIDWLRLSSTGYSVVATTAESFPNAIACFPFHAGQELVVVCADGYIHRTRFAR